MINFTLNKAYQTSIQLVNILITQTLYVGGMHALNLLINRFTLLSPLQYITPLGRSRQITLLGNGPLTPLRSRVDRIFHTFRLNAPQFGPYALLMAASFGSGTIHSIINASFAFLEKPQAPISPADAQKDLAAFRALPTPQDLSISVAPPTTKEDVD